MNQAVELFAVQQTATEILAENARDMATTKLVAKRFPDAIRKGGEWQSLSVDLSNAKGVHVMLLNPMSEQRALMVEVYVTLKPKGCEPVRVYGTQTYHLTSGHVEALLLSNPKLVLEALASVWKES